MLKQEKRYIESIGREIDIVQLNVIAEEEMQEAFQTGKPYVAAAIAVKYGTREWREKTDAEIREQFHRKGLLELSEAIMEISGHMENAEKKSESRVSVSNIG